MALDKFQSTIGQQQISSMENNFPGLQGVGYQFQAIPSRHLSSFQVTTPAIEQAVRATGLMCTAKGAGLGAKTSSCWQKMHEVVELGSCHPVAPLSKEEAPSKCWLCDYCICSQQGKIVHKLKNKLTKILKNEFKTVERKQLLLSGAVVARFLESTDANVVGAPASSSSNDRCMSTSLLLHIPLMYLSPYRATLHEVHRVECPEPGLGYNADRVLYVEVLGLWLGIE